MSSEHCHAIVLTNLSYGESDLIVTLFTLEHGKLRGFARGARASRRRFGGSLEPANRLELLLTPKDEGLSRIERIEANLTTPGLRERLESLALALYACELTDALAPEGHPLPRLFRLLTALLEHSAQTPGSMEDRCFFEINLLNILGYRPLLDGPELQTLRLCLQTGIFGNVCFSDNELSAAARLLDREITRHCTRPLKSRIFLEDVS